MPGRAGLSSALLQVVASATALATTPHDYPMGRRHPGESRPSYERADSQDATSQRQAGRPEVVPTALADASSRLSLIRSKNRLHCGLGNLRTAPSRSREFRVNTKLSDCATSTQSAPLPHARLLRQPSVRFSLFASKWKHSFCDNRRKLSAERPGAGPIGTNYATEGVIESQGISIQQ